MPCFIQKVPPSQQNKSVYFKARSRLRHLAIAARGVRENSQEGTGPDDAAYLEMILGDSADRLPTQLSVSTSTRLCK